VLAGGVPTRSIRTAEDGWAVEVIDQTRLPHVVCFVRLETPEEAADAIRRMQVRGAPLIGTTAAYAVALAMRRDPGDACLDATASLLVATRPTGANLRWAVDEMKSLLEPLSPELRAKEAYRRAVAIADEDVEICRRIGEHGAGLLRAAAESAPHPSPLNVLTHCNAGWLATVDWGTALAPIYRVHKDGLALHVWVSETRPRNQGALTAWELGQQGVPHTVVPDNAAGHLLRTGRVDLVITGTDRTTAAGDVCNKIGTYLKAVAARDSGIPFYAAVPGPSIDWTLHGPDGVPIEERAAEEVAEVRGLSRDGSLETVRIAPAGSAVANFAFDVTPARLVTAIITERGICDASPKGLASLYPERAGKRIRTPETG
jgi:methylthioribose-1-phosphate isomerase